MPNSLKQKTISGVIWSAIERFSVQGVQFFVTIIMARLLLPEEYGLIGLLIVFLAISQVIIDSGFASALIRKQNRTDEDNSTVFWFNLAASLLLYIGLFFLAPVVADFYKIPELCLLMRVLCFRIILSSLNVVQYTLFSAKLDFKTPARIAFTSAVISGIVGVILAYVGFGVWALIGQQFASSLVSISIIWFVSSWRPKMIFSKKSFKELFGFGSKMLASALLDRAYGNIYPLVIGKTFSAADVGFYNRALHFAQFPSSNVTGIIQKVTYPVLCKLQNDNEALARNYRKLLRMSAYIIFPLMLLLAAIAEPTVIALVGEKWRFSAILLIIMCFAMMWYPIHSINLNLLQVKGRSDLFLKLEIIKKIVGVIVLVSTLPFGIVALCLGKIVSSLISLIINTHYTGKLIQVGFLRQLRDLLPTIALSLTMWFVVSTVIPFISNVYLQIGIGILVGALIYLGGSYLFHVEELGYIKEILASRRKK